jgi:hypothetical protein
LKDDGVFAKGDCLYIRGVHESTLACQNWIKNAHNSTLHNSPTFTAKEGFKGGGTAYINNHYAPATDAVNLTLTSMTLAIMDTEIGTVNSTCPIGCLDTTPSNSYLYINFRSANTEQAYLAATAVPNGYANLAANKYLTFTKTGNNVAAYEDAVNVGTLATTNAAQLPDSIIFELAQASATNVAQLLYNGERAFSFLGGYLTPTEVTALYNRIKYFYDNVGGTF